MYSSGLLEFVQYSRKQVPADLQPPQRTGRTKRTTCGSTDMRLRRWYKLQGEGVEIHAPMVDTPYNPPYCFGNIRTSPKFPQNVVTTIPEICGVSVTPPSPLLHHFLTPSSPPRHSLAAHFQLPFCLFGHSLASFCFLFAPSLPLLKCRTRKT